MRWSSAPLLHSLLLEVSGVPVPVDEDRWMTRSRIGENKSVVKEDIYGFVLFLGNADLEWKCSVATGVFRLKNEFGATGLTDGFQFKKRKLKTGLRRWLRGYALVLEV